MPEAVLLGARSAPPIPPEALQRRRIAARVNVSPAVADVLAGHAYGWVRDSVVSVTAGEAGPVMGEVRR